MNKNSQILFIIQFLKENPNSTTEKVKKTAIARGVCTEDSFENVIKQMEHKSYIKVTSDNQVEVLVSEKELAKLSKSSMAQTFVNGGSTDRMIFTPPNTNLP